MGAWAGYRYRLAFALGVAFATASCAGSSLSQSSFVPHQQLLGQRGASVAAGSLIAPGARSQDLLYVSDFQSVIVYSYPNGKYEGTLRGFNIAMGECVDSTGDVYVTDQGYGDVFEYAHGGTKRLRTIPSAIPFGCSVDPTSGNLAVTDGRGIDVYTDARGEPRRYRDPDFEQMYFCGYDSQGNLFFDGLGHPPVPGNFVFAELPKGASKPITVTLNQYFYWPGGVQWDGTYITAVDWNATNIYAFSISGSHGTLVRTTELLGAKSVMQPWIQGSRVIVPDAITGKPGHALIYAYPAGGASIENISKDLRTPLAVTVSKATN